MKRAIRSLMGCLLTVATAAHAQETGKEFSIAERGPHHRIWVRPASDGAAAPETQGTAGSYTEIAAGLHFFKDGQWTETREEIELFQDGAAARNGPHQVIWVFSISSG